MGFSGEECEEYRIVENTVKTVILFFVFFMQHLNFSTCGDTLENRCGTFRQQYIDLVAQCEKAI